MIKRGYNILTFVDEGTVDLAITKEANEIFLHPDRDLLSSSRTNNIFQNELKVFLSYSSKDKNIIENIINELQIHGINASYDKYEIRPSDSIVDKINNGLDNSDAGIIFVSKNFMNFATGWTKSELNHYIKKRVHSGKSDFICLNFDVNHEDLPPLVQEYRYIDLRDDAAKRMLVDTLKGKSKKYKNLA